MLHPDILHNIWSFLANIDKLIIKNKLIIDTSSCRIFIKLGYLKLLQKYYTNIIRSLLITCDYAAENDQFEILQWLRSIGCILTESTCIHAANNGNLEMFSWLINNKCSCHYVAYIAAARNGHLDIIIYLHISKIYRLGSWIFVPAAENGHLHIVIWAMANGYIWYNQIYEVAKRNGHHHIIRWAQNNGY